MRAACVCVWECLWAAEPRKSRRSVMSCHACLRLLCRGRFWMCELGVRRHVFGTLRSHRRLLLKVCFGDLPAPHSGSHVCADVPAQAALQPLRQSFQPSCSCKVSLANPFPGNIPPIAVPPQVLSEIAPSCFRDLGRLEEEPLVMLRRHCFSGPVRYRKLQRDVVRRSSLLRDFVQGSRSLKFTREEFHLKQLLKFAREGVSSEAGVR